MQPTKKFKNVVRKIDLTFPTLNANELFYCLNQGNVFFVCEAFCFLLLTLFIPKLIKR